LASLPNKRGEAKRIMNKIDKNLSIEELTDLVSNDLRKDWLKVYCVLRDWFDKAIYSTISDINTGPEIPLTGLTPYETQYRQEYDFNPSEFDVRFWNLEDWNINVDGKEYGNTVYEFGVFDDKELAEKAAEKFRRKYGNEFDEIVVKRIADDLYVIRCT